MPKKRASVQRQAQVAFENQAWSPLVSQSQQRLLFLSQGPGDEVPSDNLSVGTCFWDLRLIGMLIGDAGALMIPVASAAGSSGPPCVPSSSAGCMRRQRLNLLLLCCVYPQGHSFLCCISLLSSQTMLWHRDNVCNENWRPMPPTH